MISPIEAELEEVIGEDALLRLVEAFGGTPLYVPQQAKPDGEIVQAIGADAADALSARFAPDYIDVPLARERRARHYRAQGRSNTEIARTLGIGLRGVERLFRRLPDAPAKGSKTDPRQYTFPV